MPGLRFTLGAPSETCCSTEPEHDEHRLSTAGLPTNAATWVHVSPYMGPYSAQTVRVSVDHLCADVLCAPDILTFQRPSKHRFHFCLVQAVAFPQYY
jgi:hypothetical protein